MKMGVSLSNLISRQKTVIKTPQKTEILIENLATGNENKSLSINQLVESSSSTLKQINTNSNYFKKKYFFLKKTQMEIYFKK